MKFTLDIPNKFLPKILPLIEYLKSLDFIKVNEQDDDNTIPLTSSQKKTLDQRRKTANQASYIPWSDAKKKLKVKRSPK